MTKQCEIMSELFLPLSKLVLHGTFCVWLIEAVCTLSTEIGR